MKKLFDNEIVLESKHNSSNQLNFGNGRAYRTAKYKQNSNEMIKKFVELGIDIPEKVPLAVYIKYYYPTPKSGGLPITRHTKDLDSTKSVLDSLMQAGKIINTRNGVSEAMFDDSQVVMELLEKKYWNNSLYGLHIQVIELEKGDDLKDVRNSLGGNSFGFI